VAVAAGSTADLGKHSVRRAYGEKRTADERHQQKDKKAIRMRQPWQSNPSLAAVAADSGVTFGVLRTHLIIGNECAALAVL
jgi:hypothetical protein